MPFVSVDIFFTATIDVAPVIATGNINLLEIRADKLLAIAGDNALETSRWNIQDLRRKNDLE
jgi:hypothetical protein